ncbi:MAG: 50S ribosomal protein L21 [Alphaproteobacteria bacterium MarineAlpha8_Bin1]|nr:MAG: 50S ribosomal protein L21 [Alphaproteobacteria bacterium MarineAlpha8_Bin1]|tara:strand:+ start:373 stop:768 length:396 start_codon:yes stop_codon:yes gene_type:complete
MFAIFELLGKQYKVSVGSFIKLPKQSCKKDDSIVFDKILFLKDQNGGLIVGSPNVQNAFVKGKVVDQIRDKKIIVFKKKRRHNYRRKLGHRQDLTLIKILEIGTSKSNVAKKDSKSTLQKTTEKLGDNNGS